MHAVMGAGRLIAGRYRLQGPIGRGAMGIVWRGRDELLARDVAVKEVQISALASASESEAIYQRTLREARTAARLKHPSVVTVYDVVEEGGSPWIIMELVEARSLDRIVTEDGPLPPLEAAELGSSLVSALATAHAAGVLHRDVKPSNVLVGRDGTAVLTDFGIATFAEDPSMTQAGMVVGTPGFTAPERVRGDVATAASDLWSLGATLYAAVEGRGPFERVGGSTVITAGVATEDAPRAPSAGPLAPVIDALLSREPGSRPDATTAARMLSDAATTARTGARSLGVGWLDADAGPAVPGDAGGTSAGAGNSAAGDGAVTDAVAGNSVADNSVATDAFARNAAASNSGARDAAAPADAGGSPASAGHAGAATGGGSSPASAPRRAHSREISEQRAAFLAPPVYAELSIPDRSGPGEVRDDAALAREQASGEASKPGPVLGSDGEPILWEPMKPASGEAQGGAGAGQGGPSRAGGAGGPGGSGGSSGPGGNGWLRFWNQSGPPKPSSGRWRLMVAGAGIAAIVIAALVGWDIYARTQTTQALNPSPLSTHAVGSSSSVHPAASGSTSAGGRHGSTPATGKQGAAPPPGHSLGSGQPTAGPSRKPSSSTSPSTHPSPSASATPTPSASPTPSPSTSPRGTGPVLPAGWYWHDFSAAELGTTAGFKIGLPGAWTQNLTGQIAHFNQPVRNFHLTVNVGLWTYPKPLAEAKYIAKKDAANYNGYTQLVLRAVGFKVIGGFKAAPAAELKFSWTKPSGGNFTELVILVSLTTKAGVQTYRFSLWAPTASFAAAHGVYHAALETFRPLPAV
ncbi:MAG TPA: serine/threonine-protein kinase [Streptosporangiaceae bacterium]|nr:serine/threonine-protein kinase [Streptosporangiaceae bacterium]